MKRKIRNLSGRWMVFLLFAFLAAASFIAKAEPSGDETLRLLDFPASDSGRINSLPHGGRKYVDYAEALREWHTISDINAWIGQTFRYDKERAMQLAADNAGNRPEIYLPEETFRKQGGVCIDLARFAVETARTVQPGAMVKYLLIEFEPVRIGNHIFQKHWLAVYQENGRLYVFADTKQPGLARGPYRDIAEFIAEYQEFRGRKILSYRLLDTYQKQFKKNFRMSKQ